MTKIDLKKVYRERIKPKLTEAEQQAMEAALTAPLLSKEEIRQKLRSAKKRLERFCVVSAIMILSGCASITDPPACVPGVSVVAIMAKEQFTAKDLDMLYLATEGCRYVQSQSRKCDLRDGLQQYILTYGAATVQYRQKGDQIVFEAVEQYENTP